MASKLYMFVVTISYILHLTSSTNPGLKARITQAGFDYATTVALDTLSSKVVGSSIPDQHGHSGDLSYDVTNLRVTNFVKPQSSITPMRNPPTGLRWTAAGTRLSMDGNWHYKYKLGPIPVEDSGSFDISVNGLSFVLDFKLGSDSSGRPNISATGCSCSVDVNFHGGASIIYNLFKSQIGDAIRGALQGKMCGIIRDAVNTDAENALKKLEVTTRIANVFMLDYRLVSNPMFAPSYMETYHKGEVYWATTMTEAPFSVPEMPDTGGTKRMLYLWVSDYVFNTLTYQAQIHKVLTYNLTAKDLPPSNRGILNTTCLDIVCIGNLIPQIGMKFPNRQIELRMTSRQTPVMMVEDNNIKVLCGGLIAMYANSPTTPPVYLLTLNVTMNATINMSIKDEKIHAKIEKLTFSVTVLNSAVGKISSKALQMVIDGALRLFVEPQLNALGEKGFPLPTTGDIKFTNIALSLEKNTLVIATDVVYGSDKDAALKFVPMDNLHMDSSNTFRHL